MNLDLEGDLEIMSTTQIFIFRILKLPDKAPKPWLLPEAGPAYPGLTSLATKYLHIYKTLRRVIEGFK